MLAKVSDPNNLIHRLEPWLPEIANTLIDSYLRGKDKNVFEFGAGSSTQWLYERSRYFVSVEHNPKFCIKHTSLARRPYNAEIEKYADNFFQLILIDGRDRNVCIKSSIPKLSVGGWLVLDNSERSRYDLSLMNSWNRVDFYQKQKDRYNFTYKDWRCSIFVKP